MKKLKSSIMNLFGLKHEIDSKIYRKHIYHYFRRNEWGYETSITNVKTFKHKNNIIIEIETHRPGLLIGKAGDFIDGLMEYLEEETWIFNVKQNITIQVKECKLWNNLYR